MYSRLPASRAALTLAKQVPDQNTVFMKESPKLAHPGANRSRDALSRWGNPTFAAMCYKSEAPGIPLNLRCSCCTSSFPPQTPPSQPAAGLRPNASSRSQAPNASFRKKKLAPKISSAGFGKNIHVHEVPIPTGS